MLRGYVVAAPRPSRVPRPGTLELCHIRAWFSMATTPEPAHQLLLHVVPLVVEGGAAQGEDRGRLIDQLAVSAAAP